MTQQFYVSPEQLMKDRADFARKGIARGRSVVVISCRDGIALVAENPSPSLHKIGEIYDKIAFAAVGKYNEFESLRQAGVRYADVRGYSYDREDVTARGLASVYAQSLGAVFTAEQKPFEVELAVAEVGSSQEAGPPVPADVRRVHRRRTRLHRDGRPGRQVSEAVDAQAGEATLRLRRRRPAGAWRASWRTKDEAGQPCRRRPWRSPSWTAIRKRARGTRRAFRRLERRRHRGTAG